jgi:hypothetical protein
MQIPTPLPGMAETAPDTPLALLTPDGKALIVGKRDWTSDTDCVLSEEARGF